ncbi:MAG: hypothetical protein K0S20_318 [Patescibacteria group bacterium]|jgi:hypothetical protein|nr:hypothetical protein [Patescibacteria group bacterium]
MLNKNALSEEEKEGMALIRNARELGETIPKILMDRYIKDCFICRYPGCKVNGYDRHTIGDSIPFILYSCQGCSTAFRDPWVYSGIEKSKAEENIFTAIIRIARQERLMPEVIDEDLRRYSLQELVKQTTIRLSQQGKDPKEFFDKVTFSR